MPHYIHRLRPELIQFTDTLAIRWYGLSYLAGFLIGYLILRHLSRRGLFRIPPPRVQDFLTTLAIFGIMLGGRIGYFLFYQPRTLLTDPLQLLRIWEGGMASHGGMIGCGFVLLYWSRKENVSFWNLLDNLVVAGTPGIALGRLANFINGELWGRPADLPWAVVFPLAHPEFNPNGSLTHERYNLDTLRQFVEQGLLEPRHPSQIYQALGEGLLLFLLLWFLRRTAWSRAREGRLAITFLLGYAVARFLVEFFREPDTTANIYFGWMTHGQLLTLFMFLLAALFAILPRKPGPDISPFP